MEPTREMDLFSESGPDDKCSFLSPQTQELGRAKRWGDQVVTKYGIPESFTPISTPETTPKPHENVEKNPNTVYFYNGTTIYLNDSDWQGGSIMNPYIEAIKRVGPDGKPMLMRKRLSYLLSENANLWSKGRQVLGQKGQLFTTANSKGHPTIPKIK